VIKSYFFCWKLLSKSTSEESEGPHVQFDASAENLSVHWDRSRLVTYADGDNSIRVWVRPVSALMSLQMCLSYEILTLST